MTAREALATLAGLQCWHKDAWMARVPVKFLDSGLPLSPGLRGKLERARARDCWAADCHTDLLRETLRLEPPAR